MLSNFFFTAIILMVSVPKLLGDDSKESNEKELDPNYQNTWIDPEYTENGESNGEPIDFTADESGSTTDSSDPTDSGTDDSTDDSTSSSSTDDSTSSSSEPAPTQIVVSNFCGSGVQFCSQSTVGDYCLIQQIDFDVILDPLFNNVERSIICGPNGTEMPSGNYQFDFSSLNLSPVAAPPGGQGGVATGWGQSNTLSQLRVDSYVDDIDNFMSVTCASSTLSSAQLVALGGNTFDPNNQSMASQPSSTSSPNPKVNVAMNLQGSLDFITNRPRVMLSRAPYLIRHGRDQTNGVTVSIGNSRIDQGNPCTGNTNIDELYFSGFTLTNHDLGEQYQSDPEVLLTQVNIFGPDEADLLVGSSQIPGAQEFMHPAVTEQVFYKIDPYDTFFRASYGTWVDNNKLLQYVLDWSTRNQAGNGFAQMVGNDSSVLNQGFAPTIGFASASAGGITIPPGLADNAEHLSLSIFQEIKNQAGNFFYKYYEFQTSYPSVYHQTGSGGAQADATMLAAWKLLTPLTMDSESFLFDTRNIQDRNSASVLLWPIRRANIVIRAAIPEFFLPLTFEVPQVYTDVQSVGYDYQTNEWSVDRINVIGAYADVQAELVGTENSGISTVSLTNCGPGGVEWINHITEFVNQGLGQFGTGIIDSQAVNDELTNTLNVIQPATAICLNKDALSQANSLSSHPANIFIYPTEILGSATSITQVPYSQSLAGLVVKIPVGALLIGTPQSGGTSSVTMTTRFPTAILSQLDTPPAIIPESHTRIWTRTAPNYSLTGGSNGLTANPATTVVTSRETADTYVFYKNTAKSSSDTLGCSSGGTSNFMTGSLTYTLTTGIDVSAVQNLADSSDADSSSNQSSSSGRSTFGSNSQQIIGHASFMGDGGSGGTGNENNWDYDTSKNSGYGSGTNMSLRTSFSSSDSSSNSNTTTLLLGVPKSTDHTLSLWGLGRCAANTRIYGKYVVTLATGEDGTTNPVYNANQQQLLTTGRLYQTDPVTRYQYQGKYLGYVMQPLDASNECGTVTQSALAPGGVSPGTAPTVPTCFYAGGEPSLPTP